MAIGKQPLLNLAPPPALPVICRITHWTQKGSRTCPSCHYSILDLSDLTTSNTPSTAQCSPPRRAARHCICLIAHSKQHRTITFLVSARHPIPHPARVVHHPVPPHRRIAPYRSRNHSDDSPLASFSSSITLLGLDPAVVHLASVSRTSATPHPRTHLHLSCKPSVNH